MFSVTATDTATLCGHYPKTCLRRYGAIVFKTPFNHEVGIRILVGYCIRQAAKYDTSLSPILVHSTDHYYRIYFASKNGSRRTNENLKNIGYVWYNKDTGERGFSPEPVTELQFSGPLWTGQLYEKDIVNSLKNYDLNLGSIEKINKMLLLWQDEAEAPGLYYDISDLSSRFKMSPPKMDNTFNALKNNGYLATRTHFDPQGFRTDAEIKDLKKIMINI
jgi:tRNA (guanine26-N2/guanine27-N2)-dimethyltransferase